MVPFWRGETGGLAAGGTAGEFEISDQPLRYKHTDASHIERYWRSPKCAICCAPIEKAVASNIKSLLKQAEP